jgi:hypothetical protein
MRWSKLRSLVIDGFADSLKNRLDIQSTRYGNCSCGHAWVTLDKNVIANFCTRAAYIAQGLELPSAKQNPMYKHQFANFGELSRQDAYASCWSFTHDLSIEEAVTDPDPLVQSLAVVDRRLGKRRLLSLDATKLHSLAAKLLQVRLDAERLNPHKAA